MILKGLYRQIILVPGFRTKQARIKSDDCQIAGETDQNSRIFLIDILLHMYDIYQVKLILFKCVKKTVG